MAKTNELQARAGRKWVHRHYSNPKKDKAMGKDEESEVHATMVETPIFEEGTQPASISVKNGMTINLGNYESARIDVMVTLPCYREEIPQAIEVAKSIVENAIRPEIAEVKGGR